MTPPAGVDISKLRAGLDERVDGEVRFDAGTLSAYAQDASNYRQVPIGVVVPRTVDAAVAAVAVCRAAGAPVLSRGGGTSLAGQCVNTAIVIDWTKYCHRLVSFDTAARTATVQPGAALDKVNDALAPHGLMVGPKPSTHVSCTIGGMIGNNSCGSTAQAYGKMADSVRRLEVLTYGGLRTWTGETSDEEYERILAAGGEMAGLYRRLREIRDAYLGQIRTGYPKIPRRVSGYNLDQLLPENGFHVAWAPPPIRRASTRRMRAGRTPRSRRTGSATTCATSASCWSATTTGARRCTGTSARAACTPGSRSSCGPPRASRITGRSWRTPPTWWPATTAPCPASTATASRAANCCRRCSDRT